eukprot:jgi/Ulvmu1/10862/UM007_0036.1
MLREAVDAVALMSAGQAMANLQRRPEALVPPHSALCTVHTGAIERVTPAAMAAAARMQRGCSDTARLSRWGFPD